ncbi:MAG: hypothetical protein E5V60_10485 [Mesorhizobium sp.]|uniref:hypothetical protein n=1 Tax=Mesorhizobium sp. TaxID=1871066 RepID=UPI000FE94E26|nr:hypothetical protein [Mesorhizobium sp.]RWP55720.1 MAG: hypothetical protein EOR08_33765 [Mesorhizobium sp.]TIW66975.1 MAG: hypothetical protein E5V60_10485 [Mesorhizobium sp.]
MPGFIHLAVFHGARNFVTLFPELQKLKRAWLQIGSGAWQPKRFFRGERPLAMAYGDTYAAEIYCLQPQPSLSSRTSPCCLQANRRIS